jgi:hypothetical protein
MSPYCAMGNNPVSYADPNGDIFFIIPQIGASGKGGLSIGLEIGIGIPGVLSASITGGVNLGSKTSGYWSVQGSAGGFYAGYGSSGGFAGWGYRYAGISGGVSYGAGGWGVGLSYGGTSGSLNGSLGIGWSQSGGFDWNVSGGYTYQYSPAESKSTNSSAKGGVQSVEQSIMSLAKNYQLTPEEVREALVQLAESYENSLDWSSEKLPRPGYQKCSHFVKAILSEMGIYPSSRTLTAEKWADDKTPLPGFKIIENNFQSGDIVAFKKVLTGATVHMGIMTSSTTMIYASKKEIRISNFSHRYWAKENWVGRRYIGL